MDNWDIADKEPKELCMSEERFRALFSSITDALLVHWVETDGVSGTFIEANDIACDLLGYSREQLLGMTPSDIAAPDSGVDVDAIRQKLEFGNNVLFEQTHIARNGCRIHVEINSRVFMLNSRPAVMSLIRDISKRKMSEEALQRTQYSVDKAREAILFVKPDAGFAYVNEAACCYLGYTREELLSMTVFDIDPEFPKENWAEYWHKIISTESYMRQTVHKAKDGRIIPVEIATNPMRFAGEQYYCAYIRDISERKYAEKTLQESERKYRELVENANSIILRWDRHGRITFLNEFGQRFFGYSPEEIIGRHVVGAIVPLSESTGRDMQPFIEDIYTNPAKYERNINENMLKSGELVWIDWTNKAVMDDSGRLVEVLSIGSDITERKIAEKKMKKLSTAVEQSSDWILITDRDGRIEYVNDAVEQMTGYKREEILNKTPRIFKSGKYDNKFYKGMWDTILSGQTFAGILTNRKKNGLPFEVYHTVTPIKDDNGKITHFVATSKDITAMRQMEERINFLANYDDLTELPNRTLFTDRLIQAVSRAEYNERSTAVLFIDIDRFHLINEALGLSVGDACLREIANRLPRVVREGDIVARFGSDEFGVALIDMDKSEDVILILEDISKILSNPIKADAEEAVLTFSIGISIYPEDGAHVKKVMQNADIACQKVREQGGNSYQFFTPDMNAKASEFISMERNLFNAILNDEFILYYQPYFDIHTRKMVGMEALIRWQSHDRGLVPPGNFIPVLEKTGMIIEVGEWVLRTAIRQVKEWQDQGCPVVPVSVNLSLVQFRQKDLVETVKNLLEEFNISPSLLVLEITESAFMEDIKFTKAILGELKSLGLSISIDDFGTGYSSLSYLKRFPVDNLKIDISFVREIATDSDSASIVSAIVTMASALNLKTIAEGIETEAQLRILHALNCNTGQGYYFSKPLPLVSLEKYWIENCTNRNVD
jgi:diguanylate cyclase (GGDEF)-like protein/PAS domain S-box-containing protein